MREHYQKSCDAIFQFRSHKEVLIRRSVVMLIPTLAAYDTPAFCENFLHTSMSYLLSQLGKPAERSFAFVAIGHIAKPVRSEIKSFLEPIMKREEPCCMCRSNRRCLLARSLARSYRRRSATMVIHEKLRLES